MARVAVGGKSGAERRAQQAREAAAAAAADTGPARRGEDDERQPKEQEATPAAVEPALPAQQTTTAVEPVAEPEVALIDPKADPTEQLAVCERGIHAAKAQWTARVAAATDDFIAEAGPYLVWVHKKKLYKLMLDNSGKPYRTFAKYLKEQHDLPERTGYRITQTIPLLRILKEAGHPLPDLSARQVAALHPVQLQHGREAVVRVWVTASETKKGPLPTPDELEKAKVLLDLSTKPDPDDDEAKAVTAAADPGAVIERASKILVPDTVREAVKQDPERVRQLVRVLSSALTEAGVPLD
ncbi:MAG: hypothetical protein HOY79_33615 [Streptomyces sp.]|nr:hypothetical protein [Streptomyces sp.]NUS11369.1 hypothetical protein [Streptomyces sp.]NUS23490.1 hypothetical protein [Streptomyces sp.]